MTLIESNGIEVPKELTIDFFRKSVENGFKLRNVAVTKIQISSGTSGGNNYSSDIFRAVIGYSQNGTNSNSNEISLIIKYMKEGSPSNEVFFYKNIISQLEKLMEKDCVIFAPKCYYIETAPKLIFVLEDLNVSGFVLKDRIIGLDENHSTILLRKIAQFHGASMVLAQQNPKLLEHFENAYTKLLEENRNATWVVEIFSKNLPYIADFIENWPGFEDISRKLRGITDTVLDKMIGCLKSGNGIKALNHNDLWVNNILFKYDSTGPCDVSIIDFQVPHYGGIGHDVHNFLYTSVQLDVLKNKRQELLTAYYDSLKSTLSTLDYKPIPSWEDFEKEIHSKEFQGFFTLESYLPMTCLDRNSSKKSSLEEYNNLNDAELKRKMMFASERVTETLKYALPRFDKLGILD